MAYIQSVRLFIVEGPAVMLDSFFKTFCSGKFESGRADCTGRRSGSKGKGTEAQLVVLCLLLTLLCHRDNVLL